MKHDTVLEGEQVRDGLSIAQPVTKRLKDALKRIDEIHPPLGHHLRACVKTGYYCAYTPSRDQPVAWNF